MPVVDEKQNLLSNPGATNSPSAEPDLANSPTSERHFFDDLTLDS